MKNPCAHAPHWNHHSRCSCTRFSLKQLVGSLASSASRSVLITEEEERAECSDSIALSACLFCCHPRAVWLAEPRSHLLYFAVSRVAPFAVQTGDVSVTSASDQHHVGTVCWLMDRQISLSVWCYSACDQGGKWTPTSSHMPINVFAENMFV